jgi:glucose-1-phosphate thymidylyltransferase
MNPPVAVIPVAGVGTRLRPHTHTVPKALINVAGKAMVAHIMDELIELGVREFVLVVGYMGSRVRKYVDRHYPGVTVHFVEQPERRGLGHAIFLTREAVGNRRMLIVLGDTIFRVDFRGVLGREVTQIGVKEVEDPRRFGVAVMEGERVRRFVEKPKDPVSRLAIVGIYYVVDSAALFESLGGLIDRGQTNQGEYQLTDALQAMLEKGIPMETFPVEGWYDCGKPETLFETNRSLLDLSSTVPEIEGSVVIPPVAVDPRAVVRNCVLGPYAVVAAGAVVENSVIRNSIVNEGARVSAVVLDSSLVGEDAVVEGSFRRLNVGDSSEVDLS